MSKDFTTDARLSYRTGWNTAIRTAIAGLSIECRHDSRLDRYTTDVMLALLMGLHEDELNMTEDELKGISHATDQEDC